MARRVQATQPCDPPADGPASDHARNVEDQVRNAAPDSETADAGQAKPLGSPLRQALVVGAVIFAALAGVAGWFGYRAFQAREGLQQQAMFMQVASQGAVNLATIDFTDVDAEVQRMLSSSTGTFLNDFQARAPAFIDFVKKVKSQTQGSIRQAGLESLNGNEAKVLVAMSVKVGAAGAPPDERRWRMRVTVQKGTDGAVKVSNVEFVP
jgi:Mce-associated membrane protein